MKLRKINTLGMSAKTIALFLGASALSFTSCRDNDFDWNEHYNQDVEHAYAEFIESVFGEIGPDFSWDLSTSYGTRAAGDPTYVFNKQASPYTIEKNTTLAWMQAHLPEKSFHKEACSWGLCVEDNYTVPGQGQNYRNGHRHNNRAEGETFTMEVPSTPFTITPIYQGESLCWNFHVVFLDQNTGSTLQDVKLFEKTGINPATGSNLGLLWHEKHHVICNTCASTGKIQYPEDNYSIVSIANNNNEILDWYVGGNPGIRANAGCKYYKEQDGNKIYLYTVYENKRHYLAINVQQGGSTRLVNVDSRNNASEVNYIDDFHKLLKIGDYFVGNDNGYLKFERTSDNTRIDQLRNDNSWRWDFVNWSTCPSCKGAWCESAHSTTNCPGLTTLPKFADAANATDMAAYPVEFIPGENCPVGAIMIFYLENTCAPKTTGNNTPSCLDHQGHVGNANHWRCSVDPGHGKLWSTTNMIALKCDKPTTCPVPASATGKSSADMEVVMIGCEDCDVVGSTDQNMVNCDWDYNDLVLLVAGENAPKIIPTEIKKRYMVEDLGYGTQAQSINHSDIDFNDIVIDFERTTTINPAFNRGTLTNLNKTNTDKVIVRALGGTLDFEMYAGDTKIFQKNQWTTGLNSSYRVFNTSTISSIDAHIMYNTGGVGKASLDPESIDGNFIQGTYIAEFSITADKWDPNTNNVKFKIIEPNSNKPFGDSSMSGDTGNESTFIYFPDNGTKNPRIIAFDPTQEWQEEREAVSEAWLRSNKNHPLQGSRSN